MGSFCVLISGFLVICFFGLYFVFGFLFFALTAFGLAFPGLGPPTFEVSRPGTSKR